jgi:hypothetical protein
MQALFAEGICKLTDGFPRGCFFLTDQLNRAALSIATNIAEGNGRFTKPDRHIFFTIARQAIWPRARTTTSCIDIFIEPDMLGSVAGSSRFVEAIKRELRCESGTAPQR